MFIGFCFGCCMHERASAEERSCTYSGATSGAAAHQLRPARKSESYAVSVFSVACATILSVACARVLAVTYSGSVLGVTQVLSEASGVRQRTAVKTKRLRHANPYHQIRQGAKHRWKLQVKVYNINSDTVLYTKNRIHLLSLLWRIHYWLYYDASFDYFFYFVIIHISFFFTSYSLGGGAVNLTYEDS